MKKRVLFVCTGNTCRSPMAEMMLRKKAAAKGCNLEVRSAGLSAFNGAGASKAAIRVMEEKGIDHRSHRSRPISAEEVTWADLIFTMTSAHRQLLVQSFPEAADKLYTLKEFTLEASEKEKIKSLQRLQAEMETRRVMLEQARKEGNTIREKELQGELEHQEKSFRSLWGELSGVLSQMDVADPFGGDLDEYRRSAAEIEEQVEKLLDQWREKKDGGS